MLYLYNSLTRKKEKFVTLIDKKVKIYVCGITPYDITHLGHAFTYVFFDVLIRYLRFKKYNVNYTQNVTDIDDDILKKAKEENRDWRELGNFWINKFLSDMKSLNVLPSTNYVKATNSIPTMIEMIRVLKKKGFAYQRGGNVYFEVKKFKKYGKLSGFNYNQMLLISKERGGNPNDVLKKDPLDFLLWQESKIGEPFWESPWTMVNAGKGEGRPGWHIECSSMINKYLGDQIDIHGGGRDLVFPHHESEIAQSESYTNSKPFVKYWIHTAMLLSLGEKMAKSLGNLVMVSDLLKKYSADAIRWVLLSHHYRTPWEFDEDELDEAERNASLVSAVKNVTSNEVGDPQGIPPRQLAGRNDNELNGNLKHFISLMDDDLNTPDVLKLIVRLSKTSFQQQTIVSFLSTLGFRM